MFIQGFLWHTHSKNIQHFSPHCPNLKKSFYIRKIKRLGMFLIQTFVILPIKLNILKKAFWSSILSYFQWFQFRTFWGAFLVFLSFLKIFCEALPHLKVYLALIFFYKGVWCLYWYILYVLIVWNPPKFRTLQ